MTAERPIPATRPKPYRARLRFERLPATYCHPERIGKLLPEGLPVSFRDRLLASKRLRLRLSALIAKRFALAPLTLGDLATPEGRFAQLEGHALKDAMRRIGAIWQAHNIRKIILKEPLRRLHERLGRDNHRAALRFIDLAPSQITDQDQLDADNPDIDRLMAWIERDAVIAINAWRREQPAALADRLWLKLSPGPGSDNEPPAGHRDLGLIIVDRVVMTLFAASQTPSNATVSADG